MLGMLVTTRVSILLDPLSIRTKKKNSSSMYASVCISQYMYLKFEFILNLQFQPSTIEFILISLLSIFATSFSSEKLDSRLLICSILSTQRVVSELLTISL